MATRLKKIRNSLVRNATAVKATGAKLTPASAVALGLMSATAALTVGLSVTLTAVVVLGLIKPKDESFYKAAPYASLAGTGVGALLGLVYGSQASGKKPSHQASGEQTKAGTGWRDFVVTRKVKESEEIASFYLQPKDKGELPTFQPGQFLTVQLEIPGEAKPIIRTYSLSDYSELPDAYRLSIKREPSPPDLDVPAGLASNFMHDQIQEGSIIPAKPPSGKFTLDVRSPLPIGLISNGVGITPMISMAKAATQLNPDRPIWFVHGAKNSRFHAFRNEIMTVAAQNPNLKLHFAYSRPQAEDSGHYHSTGHVTTELVRSLISHEAEYFLCGSPPFLASLREGLKNAGVPDSRVFFESFMKARKATSDGSSSEVSNGQESAEIVFDRAGKTATWTADSTSLLDFAEANDLNPPYSCRQGICGTCMCKIIEGEVEYVETPTAEIEAGAVLTCISKPKTAKVVLDL